MIDVLLTVGYAFGGIVCAMAWVWVTQTRLSELTPHGKDTAVVAVLFWPFSICVIIWLLALQPTRAFVYVLLTTMENFLVKPKKGTK